MTVVKDTATALLDRSRSVRAQAWTRAELRVLNRYLRKLYTSRCLTVRGAALACSRELGGRRGPEAVREQLKTLVEKTRLPRFHGFSALAERRLPESYARRVASGGIRSWHEAAEKCHKELERRRARLIRSAPKWLRKVYVRSVDTVELDILHAARRLGLREPRYVRWTEEEDRMVERWRRWYRRYRRVRRLAPLKQAAEGLREELLNKGFKRSFAACSCRIAEYWRRQL